MYAHQNLGDLSYSLIILVKSSLIWYNIQINNTKKYM